MLRRMDDRAANPRLWLAALVVCGLFIAEDPAILAARARFGGSAAERVGIDVGLALLMIAYNFAGTRYVVSVASSMRLVEAVAAADDERATRIACIRSRRLRAVRRAVSHLNPFDLIKVVGEWIGRSVERIAASARHRYLYRAASLVEDFGTVNVLGVPGAGLALSTYGREVSRWRTMRLSVLFVMSWFVGARLVGWAVGRAHAVPVVGTAIATVTGAVGSTFAQLTDVTQPVGALALCAMTAAVMQSTRQVERAHRRQLAGAGR